MSFFSYPYPILPISVFPALLALAAVITTAFLLTKQTGVPSALGRNSTIDGLRGYLAFFVFLHHSVVWYFYLHTGKWALPPSNLYIHLGQSSVALFFMITGFLFWSKLIDAKSKPIDWTKLFVSRLLRLTPLYLFVMVFVFCIVAFQSSLTLKTSVVWLLIPIFEWLSFTVFGDSDINTIQTSHIVAGVTWSLPYEWFFYFSLPVFAAILKIKVPIKFLLFSSLIVLGLVFWQPKLHHIGAFAGGIVSAYLVRGDFIRKLAVHWLSSIIVVLLLGLVVVFFNTAYEAVPLILLSIVFALIACGNTLFGILTTATSKMLGEMAYSIYLLHGLLLYLTFKFLIGVENMVAMTPTMHWLIVISCSPFLVLICYLTFLNVEKPGMMLTMRVTDWAHSLRKPPQN